MSSKSKADQTVRVEEPRKRDIRRRLKKWGKAHFATFPWRDTTSRFHALIAEVFLQRTRAAQVLPVYEKVCTRFPDPASLARTSDKELWDTFFSLGLHWRIPLIRRLAQALVEKCDGNIPEDFESLRSLPGVGPYASAAFLSFHSRKRQAIVDANVVRLYGRVFGFPVHGETRRERWFIRLAEKMTPQSGFREYNYAILDFTREICRPRPLCSECPLNDICVYGTSLLSAAKASNVSKHP